MAIEEYFLRGTENTITLHLKEAGQLIQDPWNELNLVFGPEGTPSLTVTRQTNERGISLVNGVLEITPFHMDDAGIDQLLRRWYPIQVQLKTPGNPEGVWWGARDSGAKIWFFVSEPP